MAKIKVLDSDITVIKVNNEDFISLTDMLKSKDGDFFISDWLRNRNTIEYLGFHLAKKLLDRGDTKETI